MSAAQKLINEGIERGIRAMLKLSIDAVTIAAALEMPQNTVNQLIGKIQGAQQSWLRFFLFPQKFVYQTIEIT